MAAGLSSGCHLTAVPSLPTALELCPLCPFRAMHSSENDVLSLSLSVDNVHFVFLVREVAIVGTPCVCCEEVY